MCCHGTTYSVVLDILLSMQKYAERIDSVEIDLAMVMDPFKNVCIQTMI